MQQAPCSRNFSSTPGRDKMKRHDFGIEVVLPGEGKIGEG